MQRAPETCRVLPQNVIKTNATRCIKLVVLINGAQSQLTGQELMIVQCTEAGAGRLMSLSANQGYNASNNQMTVDNESEGMWKEVVTV